jgi:Leucine-rich repeat (LRR) protein
MLSPEESKIIEILCLCKPVNHPLIETLIESLGMEVSELLEKAGFYELGIFKLADFTPKLAEGDFRKRKTTSLRAIRYFPNIRFLELADNELSDLVGVENCTQIIHLKAADNQLTSLAGIEKLTGLKALVCSNHPFKFSVSKKKYLELLQLKDTGNRLKNLSGIENCTQLQTLFCGNNQLTNLSGIENCLKLRHLDCSNNQLTDLSPLYQLSSLKKLHIEGNPDLTESEITRFRQHQPNCKLIC